MIREYRKSTEYPEGRIFRRTANEEGISDEMWNALENKWDPSESASAAFVGFERSVPISEEDALKEISALD